MPFDNNILLCHDSDVPFCLSPMSIVHLVMEEPLLAKHQHYRKARSLPSHNHNAHGSSAPDVEEIDPDARIEITPSEFKDLCPAFLVQLDQRACSQKLQKESNPHRERKAFSQGLYERWRSVPSSELGF